MVHIDLNKPDRELKPGVDLWEIMKASVEKSRNGDDMIKLKMFRVRSPEDHLYDNIMLAGGGWGIGKKKLGALLKEGFNAELDPLDLIGKNIWVSLGIEAYKGKDRLKVLIDELKFAGFQPEDQVPAGCKAPEPTPSADEVPF